MEIIDQISDIISDLLCKKKAADVSRIFGRERKWAFYHRFSRSFTFDEAFIAGLKSLGYEIIIRKKN